MTQCLERSCYPGNLEAALLGFLERWSDELPMYYNARAEGAPKDHLESYDGDDDEGRDIAHPYG